MANDGLRVPIDVTHGMREVESEMTKKAVKKKGRRLALHQ
jgi:hypothetical protein